MDFLKLEALDTAVVHLEHPKLGKLYADKERQKPCTITIYGPGSPQAEAFERERDRRMAAALADRGYKAALQQTPEEKEADMLDRLCAMTADTANIEFGGEPVTRENVRGLYANPKLGWATNQVLRALNDWSQFLGE